MCTIQEQRSTQNGGPHARKLAGTVTPRVGAASSAGPGDSCGDAGGGAGGVPGPRCAQARRAAATRSVAASPVMSAEDRCVHERPEAATHGAAGACPRVGGARAGRASAARQEAEEDGGPVPVLDKGHRISSLQKFMKPLTFSQVFVNGRVKVNPLTGEIMEAVVASRPIFKAIAGAEAREKKERSESVPGSEDGKSRAAARARRQVFELCACNDLDLFFTLTLDKNHIDRYDYKAAVERLRVYFSNRVQRHGLKYVAVPELHQDGAIHFHGLCNSEAVGLTDSGRRWKGRPVYNLDWKVGFSTGVKLVGDYDRVCGYIAKYVTKATGGGTIGGRYFYHGGALAHPHVQHFNGAGAPLTGHRVEVPDAGLALLYVDLSNPENLKEMGELLK